MMDDVIGKLSEGDWVHMFPEGTRSQDGAIQPMKLGVGRMVTDASVTPLVVPFVHHGMENILRRGEWVPVNVGQNLGIIVGDALDFQPLIDEYRASGRSQQ